ncbi:hypothetical protein [Pontibacter harenae]|uniref:hypothetical protein n=1 Tax=Pontibacter harenae TaxID=2894083 RepID=UPI001E51C480|nr:hypothetical protein [Pontibacter harenae]MCC9167729.1 hypothetical protein [Pontibacter harenae]
MMVLSSNNLGDNSAFLSSIWCPYDHECLYVAFRSPFRWQGYKLAPQLADAI